MENHLNCHSAALKIQSLWRGYCTRKLLTEIYCWYDDVATNIEGKVFASCLSYKNNKSLRLLHRPYVTQNIFSGKSCQVETLKSLGSKGSPESQENTSSMSVPSELGSLGHFDEMTTDIHQTSSALLETKRNLAMELVWIQQAIESRKNYLQIKQQLN